MTGAGVWPAAAVADTVGEVLVDVSSKTARSLHRNRTMPLVARGTGNQKPNNNNKDNNK